LFQSGIWLLTGQPGVPGATEPVPWQNGIPQSMQRAAWVRISALSMRFRNSE
jgi:hypothetical protein